MSSTCVDVVGAPRGRRWPSWLSRTLIVLTLVSLAQDAASELLYPLLPLFVTGVLAAPPVLLGVVEGLADATAGFTKFLAGKWSDRRGRKPFIAVGYGLAAIGKALVAAAVVWPMVLFGRVVDRFGKGLRSAPRDALIAASVPQESLGRAFGFHRAGDTLGAVIGPLIGLLALSVVHGDIRAAMWWAIVPAVVSVLLVGLVREGGQRSRVAKRQSAELRAGAGVGERADSSGTTAHRTSSATNAAQPLSRRYWVVTITLVVIAIVNFSDALLLLRVLELGFSTTQVVWAYVLFNAVYTLGAFPAGALADRLPRPLVYAIGLGAFAIGYVGLGVVHHGAAVFVLLAVYGLFPAFTDGVGKAWVASLAPDGRGGHAQGVFQSLNNAAVLVAGVWAGLMWRVGPGRGAVPLVAAGAVAGVAALAMPGFLRRRSA